MNIRDIMRRKIKDRLKNPNQRSYNYKYEDQLAWLLPYFKISNLNSTNEEYADFFDDTNNCSVEIADAFENETDDFCHEEREIKPNISFRKRAEDSGTFGKEFQELNPADPLDVFLITIGTTLRKFSPYYLNQAKSKIFQAVQDYELQQMVDKDDQPSSSDSKR